MVGDEVYKKHFGWALKEIEGLRDRYGLKTGGIIGRTKELMSDVFVVADDDFYHYKFLMENSSKYFVEATQKIILELMERYNITFENCNEKTHVLYGRPAFIKWHEGKRTLYFFNDYKIENERRTSVDRLKQNYNVEAIVPIR